MKCQAYFLSDIRTHFNMSSVVFCSHKIRMRVCRGQGGWSEGGSE